MGIVNVLSTLPDLLVGLFAGAYADRWDRRRMMFVADLGRALLTAVIPISVWLDGPTVALILLVTFPTQVLRVLWLAAYTASVPGLVGRSQVARASAIFEAVFNVGWIVGPAIAGLLAATIGPGPTIAIDAVTFLVSSVAILFVRRPLRAERHEETHILADIREGIRFVAHEPTLRAVLALWTTTSIITAGLTTALIFYLTVDRALGAGVIGLVLSAFAVGSLAGSVVAARFAFRPVGRVMLVGAVGNGPLARHRGRRRTGSPHRRGVAGRGRPQHERARGLHHAAHDALAGRPAGPGGRDGEDAVSRADARRGAHHRDLLDTVGGAITLTGMGGLLVVAAAGFAFLPNVRNARSVTQ